jgi:acetolactate synthase-1/2/3 large subunit
VATDLGPATRYDKVVEALGGYGEMIERPEEIRPALERAFKSGLPACINVICDPGVEYPRSSVLM